MIGYLDGVVVLRNDPQIIVSVSGVGYNVLVPDTVLRNVGGVGEKVQLYIHTHVREDALELYGFLHAEELKLFERLISVSGVGPKTALGVFSAGTHSEIVDAIVKGDTSFFLVVPRLGKKNAQKLIIELKSKLGSVGELDLSSAGESDEVIIALQGFGFKTSEVRSALKEIRGKGKTPEEKIRLALKYLGK